MVRLIRLTVTNEKVPPETSCRIGSCYQLASREIALAIIDTTNLLSGVILSSYTCDDCYDEANKLIDDLIGPHYDANT